MGVLDYIRSKFNAPMRQSQYGDIEDRGNFDLPGYRQRNRSLSNFADSRGGGQFMEGQSRLADLLMRQAQGQDSIAREQLRQDQGRLQAQQMSTMASANPSNAALASRTAMQNMGNIGAQMAGQSQMAGLAERQAAAQAAGGVLGQGRQQDIAAYLGAQGLATQNAGMQQAGNMNYEQQRTQRYGIDMGVPSGKETFIGAVGGGLQAYGMGGGGGGGVSSGLTQNGIGGDIARSFLLSDVRLKENIRPVDPGALSHLPAEQRAYELASSGGSPSEQDVQEARRRIGEALALEGRTATRDAAQGIRDAGPNRFDPRQPGESAGRALGRAFIGGRTAIGRALGGGPSVGLGDELARVPSYSYNYKPGHGLPPGRRVGPMAQDIEKVIPAAVVNTPGGKMVDYARLQPAIMASLNAQEQRLAGLEAALKKRGK